MSNEISDSIISSFEQDLCALLDESLFGDIDSWMRFAHENEVEELCLHLMYLYKVMGEGDFFLLDRLYWVPQYLYSCSSLIKSCFSKVVSFTLGGMCKCSGINSRV